LSDKYKPYTDFLTVGAGGALGAMSRYLLSGQFPAISATLMVNVLGSILLGFLMYNPEYLGYVSPKKRMFFGIGFLGSFTTFSTFAVQSFQMNIPGSLLNISLNLLLTIAGVFAGRGIVIYIARRRNNGL
jgi:CrcB protein